MKRSFTDQMNRKVQINWPPQRIISLVPSQTELLCYLGLKERVVGITKFCIHPTTNFREKTKIGGTKQYHFDRIAALQPDLIIGNKEENNQTQIEQLMEHYPIWMSDIKTMEDAYHMIYQLATLTDTVELGAKLVLDIKQNLHTLPIINQPKKVAYLIWHRPYMVAAFDTFIQEMLQVAGYENAFAHLQRYPEISLDQLRSSKVDLIFLSSEPFPFKEKHIKEFQIACPNADIRIVDGELFSWYGNRLLHAVRYFGTLQKSIYQ